MMSLKLMKRFEGTDHSLDIQPACCGLERYGAVWYRSRGWSQQDKDIIDFLNCKPKSPPPLHLLDLDNENVDFGLRNKTDMAEAPM